MFHHVIVSESYYNVLNVNFSNTNETHAEKTVPYNLYPTCIMVSESFLKIPKVVSIKY